MSTNYVAEFYKNPTHKYEDFFTSYVVDEKMNKINKEIKALNSQLEAKKEEISRLYTLRYNDKFTPIEGTFVLSYECNRGYNGQDGTFDILTGLPIDVGSIEGSIHRKNVTRKSGMFSILSGYCFPLGAVVIRKYNYKIATNNSRCSFTLLYEGLVPVLDYDAPIVTDEEVRIPRYELIYDAKDFVRKMYNLPDFDTNINIKDLCNFLKYNKSTEIILRTAPSDCVNKLLNINTDKAEPIHKILNLSKSVYDYIVEKGYLKDFIQIKTSISNALKTTANKGLTKEDFFHYTDSEWVELIEKGYYWKEECRFNQVAVQDSPLFSCLEAYLRQAYNMSTAHFYKYYSFGKFMDYVCEESCNQGFQRLHDFMCELKDYLQMCETMEIKPTLYSSYLKQTHDILSRNYKIKLTEEQEEMFKKCYEGFEDYKTKDAIYVITHPSCAEDIKQEGYNLNHCVASYCHKVIQGATKIAFLRFFKNISKSLVTLEICNNAIVQARGASNRSITEKEYEAIREYALHEKLKVCVTPRD